MKIIQICLKRLLHLADSGAALFLRTKSLDLEQGKKSLLERKVKST